jgi:hypothetical protein
MPEETVTQIGFQTAHRYGLLLLSVLLVAFVLELVRRGHLKERYALLWLFAAGCSLIIGLFPGIIVHLSNWLHFQFLTFFFVLSFLFLLLLVLTFTVIISRLSERNRDLAQEVALLNQRVGELEDQE